MKEVIEVLKFIKESFINYIILIPTFTALLFFTASIFLSITLKASSSVVDDYFHYATIFFVFISFLYLLNLINQGLTRLKEHKIYKVFRYILLFLSIASSIAFTIFSFIYILDVML